MNQYMQRAIELSQHSVDIGGGPFGAVIVKDGKIVGEGHNRVTLDNNPTSHAEMVAIQDACKNLNTFDLSGCEIYTSCEPCPMCSCAIMWARLDKIYYANDKNDAATIGFDDSYFFQQVARPIKARDIPAEFMSEEATSAYIVFENWFENQSRTKY